MTVTNFPNLTSNGIGPSQIDAQGGSNVTFETLEPQISSVADVRSATTANKSYRCYFTDGDDRIQSYDQIECQHDAEAALKAQELLAVSPFSSAEVWQGKRLVGKWSNSSAVSPSHQPDADSAT